jgi:NDP-sugar pyrophosphorylase family protein
VQVVVLAGGLGTRLRPVTERIPKPMVEVAGRPFLEYIIRLLADQHLSRVLVLLGYLGEQIREYFGDGSRWGISINYATEAKQLGTAGAIRNAFGQLEKEFLLLYGDSYLPIRYTDVIETFRAVPSPCLMVVYDNRHEDTGVTNNVALDREGTVTKYEKGATSQDLQYVEAGAICFRKDVFSKLNPSQNVSLEGEIYGELIAQRQARAFITNQRFFDIGTPDRLEEFMAKL